MSEPAASMSRATVTTWASGHATNRSRCEWRATPNEVQTKGRKRSSTHSRPRATRVRSGRSGSTGWRWIGRRRLRAMDYWAEGKGGARCVGESVTPKGEAAEGLFPARRNPAGIMGAAQKAWPKTVRSGLSLGQDDRGRTPMINERDHAALPRPSLPPRRGKPTDTTPATRRSSRRSTPPPLRLREAIGHPQLPNPNKGAYALR